MYNNEMKKNEMKKILSNWYSDYTVDSIVRGRRKPKYEIIIKLNHRHNIPFEVWGDIKSYLQEHDTKQPPQHATAKGA